jgi:hypothetical protein
LVKHGRAVRLFLPGTRPGRAAVVDALGRVVSRLRLAPGANALVLCDRFAAPLGPGAYLLRLETASGTEAIPFTVTR